MNKQNQSYYISSQSTEVNFHFFFSFLTVYIDKDRKDHKMTKKGGAKNGTRLRDKGLSCEKLHVASTEADLAPPKV